MSKTKKNNAFLHPLDTVAQWYTDAQAVPAQLRKNFEEEKKKTLHNIKKLSAELKQAKDLQKKAKSLQVVATKKLKGKASKTSDSLIKKAHVEYQNMLREVQKLADEVSAAKTHLKYAKLKQKYLNALESAFLAVTKIFTKKHAKHVVKKTKSPGRRVKRKASKKTIKKAP